MIEEAKKTRRGQFVRRHPVPPDALVYRIPEAAEKLRVSKSKLWAMIADNKIEARKIGGMTVIRRGALEAYIEGIPFRNSTAKPSTEGQGGL